MKFRKDYINIILGILFSVRFYVQPAVDLSDKIGFSLGVTLIVIGLLFIWNQQKRNWLIISVLAIYLLGLIPAQIFAFNKLKDLENSPYVDYLRLKSCDMAIHYAEVDVNHNDYKYFLLDEKNDENLLRKLRKHNIKIIDVSRFHPKPLECYNKLIIIMLETDSDFGTK